MKFPYKKYYNINEFKNDYIKSLSSTFNSINTKSLSRIVKLLENADNDEKTIFRSKAVGEPPLLLAISHFLAIKDAIKAANPLSKPELLNAPATPSEILKVIRA